MKISGKEQEQNFKLIAKEYISLIGISDTIKTKIKINK